MAGQPIAPLSAAILLLVMVSMCNAQQSRGNGRFAMKNRQKYARGRIPRTLQSPLLSSNRREPEKTSPTQAQDMSFLPELQSKATKKIMPCGPFTWEFRNYDGSCNNKENIRWGAANSGQMLHWKSRSTAPTGKSLPSARLVSNIVCRQTQSNMPNRRKMSEFVTFFGQFLDHNYAATPADESNTPMDIPVPSDDMDFRGNHNNSNYMRFHRSARATSGDGPTILTALSSFTDLSAVYGDNEERCKALRLFADGKLKVSVGDKLPWNDEGASNAPSTSKHFYLAGDFRANEHVCLAILHTIWVREHNKLCESLKRDFPGWGDERLYQMARKINGAAFQSVVYNEFYPALTGRRVPRYNGYSPKVNPGISLLFSTAAYRIGHTLVGDQITRMGCGNEKLPSLRLRDVFFTAPRVLQDKDIEEFVRGMVHTPAQEVDVHVVNLLRNFLFTDVAGEELFDLVSANIQRGRDHGLPPYNQIRKIMRRSPAKSFYDITRNKQSAELLEKAYGHGNVNNVEAWVGLLAEPHIPGASMGRTNYLIFRQEFQRTRAGDRFFYMRRGVFSRQVLATIYKHGRMTMRDILLRNTNMSPHEVRSVWFAGSQTKHVMKQSAGNSLVDLKGPVRHRRTSRHLRRDRRRASSLSTSRASADR